jgi:type II secretory pathway pseudopilin PulG
MQLKKMFKRNTRGDTLVEVMLSIAIVSLAVTVAYSLASRSLQTGVLATERTQANKMVESQVEALKYRQRESLPGVWDANFKDINNFCLDVNAVGQLDFSGNLRTNWKPVFNSGSADTLSLNGTGPGYDPICTDTTHKYFVNITTKSNNNGTGTVYLATVRWESVQSSTPNQSTVYYKLPDLILTTSPSTPAVACVAKINDMVMLLDASGSMRTDISYGGTTKSRWDVLKIVVDEFINGSNDINLTPAGNHIGLVTFSAPAGPNSAKLEYPLSSDIAALQAAVNAMDIRSNTFVVPGLDVVESQFLTARPATQKVMILITDGDFNDDDQSILDRINVMKAAGVKIYTIGIGLSDEDPSVRSFLASLSTPGSIAANVESGDDLQSILNQISDILTCD